MIEVEDKIFHETWLTVNVTKCYTGINVLISFTTFLVLQNLCLAPSTLEAHNRFAIMWYGYSLQR